MASTCCALKGALVVQHSDEWRVELQRLMRWSIFTGSVREKL